MRKLLLIFFILLTVSQVIAQSWNPYVSQGIISPAPLLPIQVNGTGVISFNAGNTGSDPLSYFPGNPPNNVKLVITLSRGLPNVTPLNPATALTTIGGSWAALFTWTYDMSQNSFTGTQNQVIAGQSQGSVTVQYKVTQNSPYTQPLNGFAVVLTPPSYTSGTNATNDDAVSSFTWTEARDYGDAPVSYGSASHVIDFDNAYYYLGSLIDNDSAYLSSATANLDDITGVDDEDGVTFPALTQGYPAVIPVALTGVYGFLNGWIDWNGDGDFADAGEQVASNILLANGTYNLTVNVPGNAFASAPTFARFRLGPYGTTSSGQASWGEIEDYQVSVIPFGISGTVFDDANGMNNNYVDGVGTNAAGGIFMNLVKAVNSQVVASLPVNSNGTYSFGISNGVTANTGYIMILTATAQAPGSPLTTSTFPANWVPAGENAGTGPGDDGIADGKLALNTSSGNVTNADFGLDQMPESLDGNPGLINPGGTEQVVVPALAGSDPEDGALGSGSTLVITALATNGTLFYDGIEVALNQVIIAYDPAKLTIDPINGSPAAIFYFAFMDAAGKQDPTPATVTLTFSDLTISGKVFDDANGMNNGYVDGTGANAGGSIYMNLVQITNNQVIASLAVNSNGTFSFGTTSGVVAGGGFRLVITNAIQAPGSTLASATFPANWVPTGEILGTGSGDDGNPDGELVVNTGQESISNANFGLDQLPGSQDANAFFTNPGGSNQVIVPALSGPDPEDGSLGEGNTLIITMPAVNGTLYYNGIAVVPDQLITSYDPSLLRADPVNGPSVMTFDFAFVDAAGKQDPTPAAATLTFSDLTITGTVFDDGNGMNDSYVDGTGTNAADKIYMNLVNAATGQVTSSFPVISNGTYSFGTSDGVTANTGYTLVVTKTIQLPGNSLSEATFPSNWVPTGENRGTGTGNDGLVDGKLSVMIDQERIGDANFGLDQLPGSDDITGTHLNPGGNTRFIVPALSGTDPEEGKLGTGNTFVITTLAANGTLYYDSNPVLINQVITNYSPSLLTLDPDDGTPVVSFGYVCVDSAGFQDPSPATITITISLIPYADLSVTKTDGSGIFKTGSNVVYTIVAANAWNDDAIAYITDVAPYGTTITAWNAVFSPGATGLSNGTGNIDEVIGIPAGGMITYTVTVSVPCYFTENLVNTAKIEVHEGVTDPDPSNNSSTDTDIQNIWIGAISDDWNVDANWSIGIPGCSEGVSAVIPSGAYHWYPVIYDTAMSAANLVIAFGAYLTINPGKDLDVCGCTVISGPDALYLRSDVTSGNASFVTTQPPAITFPNDGSARVEIFLDACQENLDCSCLVSPPVSNAFSGVFAGDSLRTYNEITNTFFPVAFPSEPLNTLQGYLLSNSTSGIRTFHGKLNDSTVIKTLTSTGGAGNGWNLSGNPYPSELDLSSDLDWTNVDKVVYYYDHASGNYKPYPFNVGFGLGSRYVPSMQGFFVHVNDGFNEGVLRFNDNNRTTKGDVNFYKDLPGDLLWLKVAGDGALNDEAIIYFRPDATGGYDQDIDCFKLNGAANAPQLCGGSSDSVRLAIDALPFTGDHTIVPLEFYFTSGGTGDYSIIASRMESFSSGTRISLEDKKLNVNQVLTANPVYNFNYTAGDNPGRFLLHFYGPFYGLNDQGKDPGLRIYSSGQDVYVKDLAGSPRKGELYLYDMMGRKIAEKPVADILLNKYTFNLPDGYYIVRVITKDETYNGKVYLD